MPKCLQKQLLWKIKRNHRKSLKSAESFTYYLNGPVYENIEYKNSECEILDYKMFEYKNIYKNIYKLVDLIKKTKKRRY